MSEYSTFILTEILWEHEFLPDVIGCWKTPVSDCTSSTVLPVKCNFFLFIKDEDTGTAEIPVDHYDNKPFRDLYYKKTKSDSQNNMQPLEENLQKTGLNDT